MTDAELRETLLEARRRIDPKTRRVVAWEKIRENYPGVSKALLWKIADGHIVKNIDVRRLLGLDTYIPVPACPICNQAHTHKHGEQTYDPATQVVKPIREPSPPRLARLPIRRDDMTKAASTIKKHLTPAQVRELKELL